MTEISTVAYDLDTFCLDDFKRYVTSLHLDYNKHYQILIKKVEEQGIVADTKWFNFIHAKAEEIGVKELYEYIITFMQNSKNLKTKFFIVKIYILHMPAEK
jgi:hypothetical protein